MGLFTPLLQACYLFGACTKPWHVNGTAGTTRCKPGTGDWWTWWHYARPHVEVHRDASGHRHAGANLRGPRGRVAESVPCRRVSGGRAAPCPFCSQVSVPGFCFEPDYPSTLCAHHVDSPLAPCQTRAVPCSAASSLPPRLLTPQHGQATCSCGAHMVVLLPGVPAEPAGSDVPPTMSLGISGGQQVESNR